jgi:cobyrinic acid a,c-diamide synthase
LHRYHGPTVLGGIPYSEILNQPLPTVVSERENRTSLPHQFFVELGSLVSKYVDVDELLRRAGEAPPIEVIGVKDEYYKRRTRIAVSNDPCFSLCFQDNLDILRYFGAEMVNFSPLADEKLPPRIGGVYLTGGYLAAYGEELAANKGMLKALKDFAEKGGVIYAESGGTAYLCEDFKATRDGERVSGVGLIKARAKPGNAMLAFNELTITAESILGPTGQHVKATSTHEFSFFDIKDDNRCLKITQGMLDEHITDGFRPSQRAVCVSGFVHMGSNPDFARRLVEAASEVAGI